MVNFTSSAKKVFLSYRAYFQIVVAQCREEGDIDKSAQVGACPWKLGMLAAALALDDPVAVGEVAAVILPGVASGPSQRCKLRHGAMHGGEQRATVTLAGTGAHMGLVAVGDGCQSAVLAHLVV